MSAAASEFRDSSREYREKGRNRDFLRVGRQRTESGTARYRRSQQAVTEISSRKERRFLRMTVLLLFLTTIPAAAVCWDRIPGLSEKAEALWATFRKGETVEIEHRAAEITGAITAETTVEATADTPFLLVEEAQTGENSGENSGGGVKSAVFCGVEPEQAGPIDVSAFCEPIPADTARRLESLGVESGRLQKWGDSGRFWRYACRVRADADAAVTHEFEALGATSDEALQAAAEKISRWRKTRLAAIREVFDRPY